ncbi:hypothetical protein ATI02_3946 [Pseudomonas baetica]|uniref:Uncharacterized protein n=1 Tax=Pseudomonas baetica TaxID=674054 RepID=A0ABX4Q2H4_9PSED|nr:hypothetical protein [Pseudomonas baetica]PKA70995.1 hypothetical protein ATI02_3946 [Pseudomonas baetica]
MNQWTKTLLVLLMTASTLLVNGCHLVAQSRWEGRDVQEALDLGVSEILCSGIT